MRPTRFDRVLAGALLAALALGVPGAARAASKTYQVTGAVTEITPDTITVQKGKDLWQLNRTAETKTPAVPKVGDKVTISYSMTAASITVAPTAAPKATAKPAAERPADAAAKPAAGKPAATPAQKP